MLENVTLPSPPYIVIWSSNQGLEGKFLYGTVNKKYFHLIKGIFVPFDSKLQRGSKKKIYSQETAVYYSRSLQFLGNNVLT